MIHQIDGQRHQTPVQTNAFVQSNALSFAQPLLPRGVSITKQGGPVSGLADGLGAEKLLRLDVVKDAQLVLRMPVKLSAFD